MAAHDQTDYLLPRGRRLWHKICEKKHADHLINCLKEQYKLTKDWNSNLYCGIAFQWNYAATVTAIGCSGGGDKDDDDGSGGSSSVSHSAVTTVVMRYFVSK